jgi:predicted AlkP superfamily phosphohydrolase/phosphomutase
MSRPPRVLFIGLDALDPDLTRDWARTGVLPTFAELSNRGTTGVTRNPEGLYVGAVWPSFFTGVSPARHGRYCYKQIVTGTYTIQRFQPGHLKFHTFWTTLSDAGRRVAIVDVPKSPLAANLNGIQIKDWGTHDPEWAEGFQTTPAELAAEIIARYGSDPVGDCDKIERTADGYRVFARNLAKRIEQKTAICTDLLPSSPRATASATSAGRSTTPITRTTIQPSRARSEIRSATCTWNWTAPSAS